ncbi:hypothetical protein PORY_001462 [Pneumocystis oryctolagi]|uniref:Uncharacterized protein n=1 Tax=Pneumocystis oryctolagi TaxID=42067 RepID=A0ACB7CFL0_9ASCO|nr:hypothetical protein PORY_001462 [Pneumocystis oryctolagi]
MGLAIVKNKRKIREDPRNMKWSKDTNRFGFKLLLSYGWTPGSCLGKNKHRKIENDFAFLRERRFVSDSSFSFIGLNDLNDIFERLNHSNFQHGNSDECKSFISSKSCNVPDGLSKRFVQGESYNTDFSRYLKKELKGKE